MSGEYWRCGESGSFLPLGEGTDCFADDRDALNDFAKYYNNSHLSDVTLIIGEETYASHRLILAKSSEVFDRMLSQRWNGETKELKLVEEPACLRVFPAFLRFLYCNHIVLHPENCLPLLVLADKYNVASLKKVCLNLAVTEIIPHLDLKEIFAVWFSYATKAYHQILIRACVEMIGREFESLISTEEWEKTWLSLDRDQLLELLKFNNLVVKNEKRIWDAVQQWLSEPSHPERRGPTAAPLLSQIVPLIRFALMTADEVAGVEATTTAESFPKLFQAVISNAYKIQAISLAARAASKEYVSSQFLLRNYGDLRWDKRIVLRREQLEKGVDHEFKFQTRSYTLPPCAWQWSLKLGSSGCYSTAGEDSLKVILVAEAVDQPRYVEYMFCFVDEKKILKCIAGKNQFTKSRYSTELEMPERISVSELLSGVSPLLTNGELHMQLILKPPSGYD